MSEIQEEIGKEDIKDDQMEGDVEVAVCVPKESAKETKFEHSEDTLCLNAEDNDPKLKMFGDAIRSGCISLVASLLQEKPIDKIFKRMFSSEMSLKLKQDSAK